MQSMVLQVWGLGIYRTGSVGLLWVSAENYPRLREPDMRTTTHSLCLRTLVLKVQGSCNPIIFGALYNHIRWLWGVVNGFQAQVQAGHNYLESPSKLKPYARTTEPQAVHGQSL